MPVTSTARYPKMAGEARLLVDEQLICGMHVHVGVPDRETGVAVLNRLRVWLPRLPAMSANGPLRDGRDTGFASRRTIIFGRWPVSGRPPCFAGFLSLPADGRPRVRG
ncbi:carboxylate-amine ligase [Streptomyces sp. NBC_01351]|uniref:carboxylate-amine ligase n=1 Tax=Streptomyces sp. NBC_01351 TaxID=2903833 RepID=UPI002E360649|nr:glutamate-cysteine ligase family protein [Streptomyces sp. NBC_01351]